MSAAAEIRRHGRWIHRKKDGSLMEVDVVSHPLEFEGREARTEARTAEIERTGDTWHGRAGSDG